MKGGSPANGRKNEKIGQGSFGNHKKECILTAHSQKNTGFDKIPR